MKKLILLLLLVFGYHLGYAQDYPAKPSTYALVNDLTGTTLSESQKLALEQKLRTFEDSTSNQIAVVIVKSVGDYDINEYALEVGRKWGIGGKTKNNGVILLIAIGDRKLSIQTGYGMEGALPDIYTKRIIEDDIKPFFKEGDYYGGISAGVDSIIKLTKGEYKNDNPKAKSKGIPKGALGFALIIIIIIIAIIVKRGGGGGGGQVIGGRGVADALFWGMLLGGGRSSGGGSSSGGFGGGGGGFGGGSFGGGSFGGGGSSGSW